MAYWVDMSQAYRTMDSSYIESVWWSLKQIFDKGLLYEAHPHHAVLPSLRDRRCPTTSSASPAATRRSSIPRSIVRLPLTSGPYAGQADLLVWTTTPWTLVSNTAVSVNPEVTYVSRPTEARPLVVAEPLFE